jgi:hypothetical protein
MEIHAAEDRWWGGREYGWRVGSGDQQGGSMRRVSYFVALALAAHPAMADDEHRPVAPLPKVTRWMTGAQLLQKLSSPAEARDAEIYIKGAHDATERKVLAV